MVEVMKIMVTSFKRFHASTAALSALNPTQATTDPHLHQRLLDTHGQVWVSLLWVTGPGAYKVLFVPPRVCFPVLCKF